MSRAETQWIPRSQPGAILPPTLLEQRDNLLRVLGTELEIGPMYSISCSDLGARVGSASAGAFLLLLERMSAEGYLRGKLGAGSEGVFKLGYAGLERLEQLERSTPSGYTAFMAMKFGDADLDRIVKDYFRQAVKDTGFELYRLDDRPEAGLIDARLRNEIRNRGVCFVIWQKTLMPACGGHFLSVFGQ